jgi:molecular chaperone GrpE
MEKDWEAAIDKGPPLGEESAGPESAGAEQSIEAKLSEQLLRQQEETRQNYDHYLRALAEVENIKKRSTRDREEYLKYANVNLIKKLLPVIDDLHRAIEVARNSQDFEALSKGVEMTARSLDDLLKGEGVKVIESVGQPFDPQYHQALTVEASDEHPENTVIEQLQKGYILHDRVIRPSLVKVSS